MAKKKPPAQPDNARKVAALQARIKQLQGVKLTRQQLRDIEWLLAAERRQAIDEWTAAVPKGEYCELSGRQHKLVDDAARKYDLPLDRATINLSDALKALHDLVAANAHRLRQDLSGDRNDLEEQKLRQQIIGLERDNEKKMIELQFTRGDAIPKVAVAEALVSLSAKLRTLGQTLGRINPEARLALNEFLENLAIELESGDLAF